MLYENELGIQLDINEGSFAISGVEIESLTLRTDVGGGALRVQANLYCTEDGFEMRDLRVQLLAFDAEGRIRGIANSSNVGMALVHGLPYAFSVDVVQADSYKLQLTCASAFER